MAGEKDVDVPPDLVVSFFEQCSQAKANESNVPLKLLSIKDADHYDVRFLALSIASKIFILRINQLVQSHTTAWSEIYSSIVSFFSERENLSNKSI